MLGVGLNVTTTAAELPVTTATSLALAGATGLDRGALLATVLTALEDRLARWTAHGGDAEAAGLLLEYRTNCATLGTPVQIDLNGGGVRVGVAADVGADGTLLVRTEAGELRVSAGDVTHLRPS